MRGLILFAALFVALLFVPSTTEAGCLQGKPVRKIVAAPVRLVIQAKPVRSALRVAALPARLVVRALR
jgi:hypothetical protein